MPSAPHAARDPSRRALLLGMSSLALAGCSVSGGPDQASLVPTAFPNRYFGGIYAALPDEPFPVPAIDVSRIDPRYLRQRVPYETRERPGTIVVDPGAFFLYLVEERGTALRYGVGVGREGFGWNGRAMIQRKARWPTWTPTPSMIRREPELAKYARGMPPGLENPLGARALYLYRNGRDTLYRLHGTNEPWSIGTAVSSGCIRLFNQDIIDLYNRTPTATPVRVLATVPVAV